MKTKKKPKHLFRERRFELDPRPLLVPKPAPVATSGRQATVGLSMIVKNEHDNLPRCLESVKGLFDEIVVVDTGSTDDTKEIARSYGAKVFDFEWCDDYGAARNAALDHATTDFWMWMSACEEIERASHAIVLALFSKLRRDLRHAFNFNTCSIMESDKFGYTRKIKVFSLQLRLSPRSPDIRWTRPIHEIVHWGSDGENMQLFYITDITLVHHGYEDSGIVRRKADYYHELLLRHLADNPDDATTNHCLGYDAYYAKDFESAAKFFAQSLRAPEIGTHIASAETARCLADSFLSLGRTSEALAVCERWLEVIPGDMGLLLHRARSQAGLGQYREAENGYRDLLRMHTCTSNYLDFERVSVLRGLADVQDALGDKAGAVASRFEANVINEAVLDAMRKGQTPEFLMPAAERFGHQYFTQLH